jgi:hypothetical protein
MQRLVLTILVMGILILGITAPLVSAQDAPENPLLRLLHFIPDTVENRQEVRYGDFAAWYESWDVAPPESIEAIDSMDEFDRVYTLFIMPNQTLPAQALGTDEVMRGFRDYYGFDVFNVDRFLYAGFPTNDITVIEHSLDTSQISDALTALGYQTEPHEPDATLYSLRGDYEMDSVADMPTIGKMGLLNRILMRDGQLVITRATPVLDAAWAAEMGEAPSLADNPTYAAAAQAVAAFGETYGTPLGVALLPPDFFQ